MYKRNDLSSVFLFVCFFPSFFMVQKYTTGSTQQNTRLIFPYSNKTPLCVRVSDLPPVYTEVELLRSVSVCLILNTGVRLWIRTEAEGNR